MARVRMVFSKRGRTCFVPHVEMPPLFCRSLRRIGADIEQTRGLAPHPKISLGPALPVGVPAMEEPLEVWLERWSESMIPYLNAALPKGVQILRAGVVDGRPKLNDECEAAFYRIFLREEDSHSRIRDMISGGWIPVPETLSILAGQRWVDLAVGSPGQIGAGTVVKILVSEGLIHAWKDLLVARLAVGTWTGKCVRPLLCEGEGF
ncbi:MAG: TIGR03936 family radical SAM-associated protein [Thermovirgaceae bacterium]|nr:TIGR03936 family radical SAM-associated protein [Thermovirgaceae bacterium]